ncbi:hypothetical protein BB558_006121 [Smittium angustum]|uniref:BHLH domain-containing protein n=1 Tax=Smittium angustum TaxID=133377 RepID=A0A2U1IYL2_SMIAN|nr:hypothetical protein BB558_006121 [Smittium angustum]
MNPKHHNFSHFSSFTDQPTPTSTTASSPFFPSSHAHTNKQFPKEQTHTHNTSQMSSIDKKAKRKVSHSAIEKRRREKTNAVLRKLQGLVPWLNSESKFQKLEILENAAKYIEQLTSQNLQDTDMFPEINLRNTEKSPYYLKPNPYLSPSSSQSSTTPSPQFKYVSSPISRKSDYSQLPNPKKRQNSLVTPNNSDIDDVPILENISHHQKSTPYTNHRYTLNSPSPAQNPKQMSLNFLLS